MPNNVQKDLYGVGFSPLSIKNRKYALSEEMLADKDVGLFAIYHNDGSVVSSEYISRCKYHLEGFMKKCIHDGTIGEIHRINFTDNLVKSIKETENLFTNILEYNLKNQLRFIRFSVDSDAFGKEIGVIFDPSEIKVTINFTLTTDNEEHSYTISEKLTEISNKAFAITYDDFGDIPRGSSYGLKINTFTIDLPNDFDTRIKSVVIRDILLAIN